MLTSYCTAAERNTYHLQYYIACREKYLPGTSVEINTYQLLYNSREKYLPATSSERNTYQLTTVICNVVGSFALQYLHNVRKIIMLLNVNVKYKLEVFGPMNLTAKNWTLIVSCFCNGIV